MLTSLIIGALLAGVIGLLSLTQATMGVGIVALGCLVGILARLEQADRLHRAHLRFMQQELEYLVDERLPGRSGVPRAEAQGVRPATR